MSSEIKQAALAELWKRGELNHVLRTHQKPIYEFFKTHNKACVMYHRRAGKTHTAITIAEEFALKNANSTVVFIGITSKAQSEIFLPIHQSLLDYFKPSEPPKYNAQRATFYYPNNSRLIFKGSEFDQVNSLRGYKIDFAVLDECGHHSCLEYSVGDVLGPSLRDAEGRLLYISTPSLSPAHYFKKVWDEAQSEGWSFKMTLEENPYLTEDFKQECLKDCKGRTNKYLREYLCEWVPDEEFATFPELLEAKISTGYKKPDLENWRNEHRYEHYVGLHFDGAGHTAISLCEFDKTRFGIDVIDSASLIRPNLRKTADAIKELLKKHDLPIDTLVVSELGHEFITNFIREGLRIAPVDIEDFHALVTKARGLLVPVYKQAEPQSLRIFDQNVWEHFSGAIWTQDRKKLDDSGDGGRFHFVNSVFYVLTLRPDTGDKPQSAQALLDAFRTY